MTNHVQHHRTPRNLSADELEQYLDELASCTCDECRPDLHDEPAVDVDEPAEAA